MTDFSSNLKGSGMMDERISENVHHEMGNNQMGLELWRTERGTVSVSGQDRGWGGGSPAQQPAATEKITDKQSPDQRQRGEKKAQLSSFLVSSLRMSMSTFLT